MKLLAFDIGGANIKVSDGFAFARSVDFPLWLRQNDLSKQLAEMLASSPPADRLAITMTGELADCFASRREGVTQIADAVMSASENRNALFYLVDGRLVDVEELRRDPIRAAAANWHALASYCLRIAEAQTLLVDVGSTTCDLIPLLHGKVAAIGNDDLGRLRSGELVYTGVERTPISSLLDGFRIAGRDCPIARELFATALDAHLLLGNLPEQPNASDTADGRPRTKLAATRRIARMVCSDTEDISSEDIITIARSIANRQVELLCDAINQVTAAAGQPTQVLISGHGDFLATDAIDQTLPDATRMRLVDRIGTDASRCAPAFGLAVLARERWLR